MRGGILLNLFFGVYYLILLFLMSSFSHNDILLGWFPFIIPLLTILWPVIQLHKGVYPDNPYSGLIVRIIYLYILGGVLGWLYGKYKSWKKNLTKM